MQRTANRKRRRHARDLTVSADPRPRHRRFPSPREPRRERTRGSGGRRRTKGPDSTKEPCHETRTDTAADRPLDAEKRRDTPNPSETHSPSSAFWPQAEQSKAADRTPDQTRPKARPTHTDDRWVTHLLPIGGLSGLPELPGANQLELFASAASAAEAAAGGLGRRTGMLAAPAAAEAASAATSQPQEEHDPS